MDLFKQKKSSESCQFGEISADLALLPEPGYDAQAHSKALLELIRKEIVGAGGKISFSRYMELALYAPGLGYYSSGSYKFGEQGDFITAPEISPLFSRCIAHQCEQVLNEARENQGQCILEVGAGSGAMAVDILLALDRASALPQDYYILELSADLRQRQRMAIERRIPKLLDRIHWLDELPPQGFNGIILANEVLDAMPVHRFLMSAHGAVEQFVTWRDDHLELIAGGILNQALKIRLDNKLPKLNPGYQSEISLTVGVWVKSMAERLNSGMILIIDYGYPRREYYHPQRYTGTLMCHYRHRVHDDAFVYPGLQDITTHVDFTEIAESATEADLTVSGYCTQAAFLLSSGLMELASQADQDKPKEYLKVSQQIKRLTLPGEMGESFKAMALTKGLDYPLLGFQMQDLRGRL